MRVESESPKQLKSGETGWFHFDSQRCGKIPTPEPKKSTPVVNVGAIMKGMWDDATSSVINMEARRLGVDVSALREMQWGFSRAKHAWAIPMRDGFNNLVGIRYRNDDGNKWTEAGTHTGIFIPQGAPSRTVMLPEGVTDTAAALSLGYYALGRPSCSGGNQYIIQMIRRLGIKRAIIIGDNDDSKERERGQNPGVNGALSLAKLLPIPNIILLLPGVKDLRDFYRNGGTKELIDCMINQQTWRVPKTYEQNGS
jgi:hypothetical protein